MNTFFRRDSNTVLVCVTDQFSCERLVMAGANIASGEKLPLKVMSVQKSSENINAEALEHLFNVTRSFGAEMTVFYDPNPALNFTKYVRRFSVQHLVAGISTAIDSSPFFDTIKKYNRFHKRKMLLHVVDKNGDYTTYDAVELLPGESAAENA